MALTDNERLRLLVGEPIPDDGTEVDTLFTDEQIDDLVTRHGSPELAQQEAWAIKAALMVTLVTTVEGSSRRQLSDQHKAALAQAEAVSSGGGVELSGARTVIGNIVRGFRR